jgi:hypothetical protein
LWSLRGAYAEGHPYVEAALALSAAPTPAVNVGIIAGSTGDEATASPAGSRFSTWGGSACAAGSSTTRPRSSRMTAGCSRS